MRPIKIILFLVFSLILAFSCDMRKSVLHKPDVSKFNNNRPKIVKHHDSLFSSDKNFLLKNHFGQWELYIEGDPLQRGLLYGALLDSILLKQEVIFFDKIKEFVPSQKKQKRLRKFLQWYNRKLYLHVPEENKAEIYGLSFYSSKANDHIAPPYIRSLYLHAAHDIGHALSDLALVGCTSVALWGDETEDGELLIGRNLDFYAGDEFAKEKVIAFIKPDSGYAFMSISWPGMLGVVSGMNMEGLTVTMNAGKSSIPLKAKKPITILAREILQYSKNIEEAIEIAKKSEVFVSESIMIGSANDNKSVLIEISPKNIGIFEVTNNCLVCSNHFQSENYDKDKRNQKHIVESHSKYRYDRLQELIDSTPKMTPLDLAFILRNKEGLKNKKIGYGNEKALNQLLAHHSVIFKPKSRLVWVSSNPYQLGAFTVYDLNEIFSEKRSFLKSHVVDTLVIPNDIFLNTTAYLNYEKYRILDREIDKAIENKGEGFPLTKVEDYIKLNPDFWVVHYKAGLLYYYANENLKAKIAFEDCLQKEITTLADSINLDKAIKDNNKRLK